MPGPYDGLRVIEFGRFIAAPYAAQLLADGGAEVIKVEPLLGDNTRQAQPVIPGEGRQYLNKNRGKRSLAVDLSNPEILEAVRSLVGGVDVVIANFRPGIAERLDLDYASVSGDNPRVIYAENTALGPRGPLAGAPGMDIAIQAYSGFAPLDERGPSPLPFPAIDYAAALLIAWGIATSLYHRERTGRGQKLDVSLLQASLVLQNNLMNHIDAADEWRHEYVDYLQTAFSEGKSWEDVLEHREELSPWATPRAYYGFFQTADGTIAIAAAAPPLAQRLVTALEVDDPVPVQHGLGGHGPEGARAAGRRGGHGDVPAAPDGALARAARQRRRTGGRVPHPRAGARLRAGVGERLPGTPRSRAARRDHRRGAARRFQRDAAGSRRRVADPRQA